MNGNFMTMQLIRKINEVPHEKSKTNNTKKNPIENIQLFIRSARSSGQSRILDISKYFYIHASPFICFV